MPSRSVPLYIEKKRGLVPELAWALLRHWGQATMQCRQEIGSSGSLEENQE